MNPHMESVGQMRLRLVSADAPADDGQLSLPLERDERLDLVRAFVDGPPIARLSRTMRRNVGRLLETVEMNTTRDGCRLKQEVLAAKCGTDERNLRRWLTVAQSLGVHAVIESFTDGGWQQENFYLNNWDCVRRLGETGFVHGRGTADGETGFVHDSDELTEIGETGLVHDQQAVDSDPIAEPGAPVNRGVPAQLQAPRVDNLSAPGGQNVRPPLDGLFPLGNKRAPIQPIDCFHENPIDPIDPLGPNQTKDEGRAICPPRVDKKSGRGVAGERCPLSLEVLQSPQGLNRWFEFALGKGWVREIDRLRVFTLGRSVARREKEHRGTSRAIRNPCGAFVRLVKGERWDAGSQPDEDWGRKAIRWLQSEGLS